MTLVREIDAGGGVAGWELIDADYQASGTTLTITVPGGTLAEDGESLFVRCIGESNAILQDIHLEFDGVEMNVVSMLIGTGNRAMVEAWVTRTGATAQEFHTRDRGFAGAQLATGFGTDAATLSGDIDIVATWSNPATNIMISLKAWKVGVS